MTGCVAPSLQDLRKHADETIARLVPETEQLLESLAPDADLRKHRDAATHVLSVSVLFPDGVGRGAVVARVFRYREVVRVDVELVHDRMVADGGGKATSRHCFLNDFVASVALPAGAEGLPAEFVRRVTTGVRAAIEAVETHNRRHPKPWSQIRVVAA